MLLRSTSSNLDWQMMTCHDESCRIARAGSQVRARTATDVQTAHNN
jgi:hypothetical protein